MKYPPIDKRLFIKNRKEFVDKMKPNSVEIFFLSVFLKKYILLFFVVLIDILYD